MPERLRTIEEYWPGQVEGIRTARIEVWPEGPEIGRVTAESEWFEELCERVRSQGDDASTAEVES